MTGANSAVRLPVQLCVYRKGPLQQCGGLFFAAKPFWQDSRSLSFLCYAASQDETARGSNVRAWHMGENLQP